MATLRICTIPDCNKPMHARGFCPAHYLRFWRHGQPEGVATSKGEPLRWLIAHVNHKGDDCLTWPFQRTDQGRGKVRIDGKDYQAHAEMCKRAHGPRPSKRHQSAHSCGKGHEGCVNPNHLHWATPQENQRDRLIHGTDVRGERNGMTKLTEEQVREIRALKGVMSQEKIAARFNVTRAAIGCIHRGKTWWYLPWL